MADLIREAAELTVRSLYDPKRLGRPLDDVSMLAVIEASFRETFTGAELEGSTCCWHRSKCPNRPAVAALIEARVAAARREALEEAKWFLARFEYQSYPVDGGYSSTRCSECGLFPDRPGTAPVWRERGRVGHKQDCRLGQHAAVVRALASAEPGSEVSK